MMLLMATATFTLTGCDDDDGYVADTLEGTWKGKLYMRESYNGHTYDAAYSEICFLSDPYRYASGKGYWIDQYAGDAPWEYLAYHITWEVRNGVICIRFQEDRTYVEIRDYRINNRRFEGRIYMDDTYVDFYMTHTDSPNWGSYHYGYDYWYDDYGYYAKPQPGSDDSTATREQPVRSLAVEQ